LTKQSKATDDDVMMMSGLLLIYRPLVWSLPPPETLEDSDHESIELTPLSSEDEESFEYHSNAIRTKRTSKPSLFLALCQTFIVTFVTAGFLKLIHDLLNFVGPLILKLDFIFSAISQIIFTGY